MYGCNGNCPAHKSFLVNVSQDQYQMTLEMAVSRLHPSKTDENMQRGILRAEID